MNQESLSAHLTPSDERGLRPGELRHTEVPSMSAHPRQPASRSSRSGVSCAFLATAGGVMLLLGLVMTPLASAQGEQTRDQCRKCCETKGFDEFYLEQCKLKCFRTPDHCVDSKAGAPAPAAKQAAPPTAGEQPPAAERRPPAVREAPPAPARQMQPPGATEAPPPRREAKPRPGAFTWPSPLNLTPGREWEAAGQILAVNGMAQQHPNYQRALRAVEAVLINFARNNPQGGQLPTGELEQILRQNR